MAKESIRIVERRNSYIPQENMYCEGQGGQSFYELIRKENGKDVVLTCCHSIEEARAARDSLMIDEGSF